MPWWSWLLVGVVCGVLLTIAVGVLTEVVDNRRSARVRRVNARRSASERQMVTAVQDTIERLFIEARRSGLGASGRAPLD